MAIEDLDLEFEEEDEKEKSDALDVDVDLSFSAHESGELQAPAAASPSSSSASAVEVDPSTTPRTKPTSNISEDDVTDPNLKIPAEMQKSQAPKSPTPKDSSAKVSASENKTSAPKSNSSEQNVAQISEARKKAQAQPQVQSKVTEQAQPIVQGDVNATLIKELEYYREQVEKLRSDMDHLKDELFNAKKDSEIKVAVAEMKAELMIEVRSGGQVMEHKVNQILQRIHKKVPALKGEVITIKKAMQEYLEAIKKKN
jgi:outer membrane biosynthesis protein TonB